jgi:hypothetical protein
VGDRSRSPDLEIIRRLLTAIADDLIFDCLTFIKRTKAGTFNRGDMDEHVLAPALRLNESIALGRVEPFDGASSHHGLLEMFERDRSGTTIVRSPAEVGGVLKKTAWGYASNAK